MNLEKVNVLSGSTKLLEKTFWKNNTKKKVFWEKEKKKKKKLGTNHPGGRRGEQSGDDRQEKERGKTGNVGKGGQACRSGGVHRRSTANQKRSKGTRP